jgi:hypothetical protein
MPSRKYLPLSADDVIRVLKAFGFIHKRTTGDHAQWEGEIKKIGASQPCNSSKGNTRKRG